MPSRPHPSLRLILLLLASLISACSTPRYTLDDGRQVDEALLGRIRDFGTGEQALRPAIAHSAALKDPECDKQWELPFSAATSDGLSADDRVAWVRGLGVDERLTVVGAAPGSPLKPRDKIKQIAGYSREDTLKMLEALSERRDAGKPFDITLSTGKTVKVAPFEVCRGYTRLASPATPQAQDYHWLMSLHPLQLAQADLSDDEALWVVLWTQGLSEEGGARMKLYHYSVKTASAAYNLFTLVSGIKGAALAAESAIRTAQTAAASAATEVLRQQALSLASQAAQDRIRDTLSSAGQKLTQQQILNEMQQAAANRGSLSGVARIAGTVFDKADLWAYEAAGKLGANPLAGFTLHQKLLERQFTANALMLDPERLPLLHQRAERDGRADEVVAILDGLRPSELELALGDMPLASAHTGFSYESAEDTRASADPFANGLIEGLLNMPTESGR